MLGCVAEGQEEARAGAHQVTEHSVGSASLRWFAQVADISRVSFGRHSEVFQRQWGGASAPVAAPPPWRSFSVHLPGALSRRSLSTQPAAPTTPLTLASPVTDRTLDLTTDSDEVAALWAIGLSIIVGSGRDGSADSSNFGRETGRILWMRARMRLQEQQAARSVTRPQLVAEALRKSSEGDA